MHKQFIKLSVFSAHRTEHWRTLSNRARAKAARTLPTVGTGAKCNKAVPNVMLLLIQVARRRAHHIPGRMGHRHVRGISRGAHAATGSARSGQSGAGIGRVTGMATRKSVDASPVVSQAKEYVYNVFTLTPE